MRLCVKAIQAVLLILLVFPVSAQDSTLSVQEAIRMALENNFDVRISRNESEISQVNNSWSVAGALPQISASAGKSFGSNNLKQKLGNGTITEKKGTTNRSLSAGLAVNWRIFDGFRMFATKKRLEELEHIGEYSFRKTMNETVFDVITQYYRIVTLNEQLDASREQITLYQERLELAKRKYEIGTGAKYEVLEAEVDMNAQLSDMIQIENAISTAKSGLSSLLGQVADTSYKIADTIIINALPPITETQEKITSQNPDILMANSNLNVLYEGRKEVNAAVLPSVTVNGFYNFNKNSSSAGFNLFNQTYGPSGNVALSVPLFNGGITRKQLKVADINIRNQQVQLDKLKNDINTAIVNSYLNFHSALKTIELETNNLKLATENIKIAIERYRKLNITTLELRQIQINYNATQLRLFNALNQAKTAEAMVALLTGDINTL